MAAEEAKDEKHEKLISKAVVVLVPLAVLFYPVRDSATKKHLMNHHQGGLSDSAAFNYQTKEL